jgi:hypothetical protein
VGLVKRFRGDLLPDINPTIPTARAKRWDEARQMAAQRVHADALPLALESLWPPAITTAVQAPSDVSKFDKCEIGQEAYPHYNHRGTVIVGSAWVTFYLIIAIHNFLASSN